MKPLHILSPAKLNLYLAILGRLATGYHSLQTLFVFTDLADELIFTPNSQQGEIKLITETSTQQPLAELPLEDNLIYQAAKLLQPFAQQPLGIEIKLIKNLPLGSGLGGGSSNAASTLLALNQLWQLGLTQQQLAELGLQLGADVPIFVYGQAAWAEGVGEQFTPAEIEPAHYLLIYPGLACSTAELFNHSDLPRATQRLTSKQRATTELGFNAFQSLAQRLYPAINFSFAWLEQQGLTGYLTGSGSCIYAQVKSRAEAEQLAAIYQAEATAMQEKLALEFLPQAWAISSLVTNPALEGLEFS